MKNIKKIVITAPARLHFNSLKMNQSGGRGCGGIGVALENPFLKISFSKSDKIVICGGNGFLRKEAENFAKNILKHFNILSGANIKIINFYPNQVGLGSGTQLGLSIGKGLALLYDKKITLDEIAFITKVAGVSGIGFYSFSHGGLIIDGGYKMGNNEIKKNFGDHSPTPPPLSCNFKISSKWKIVLIAPKKTSSEISKIDEKKLFMKSTPIPLEEIGAICTNVLMGIIPSVQENDYFKFIEYLADITNIGTKKIELELNKKTLKRINDCLSSILDYKLVRIKSQKYSLLPNGTKYIKEKYSHDKLPFIMLSSLGNTFYSILSEEYHNINLIMKNLNKNLPTSWTATLTRVNNRGAKIDIVR
ncbi:MAG: beta-ribofuranosylaminobenzene 5'-phosphate synthase family protein [Patescibacteria group bacterium]